MEGASPLPQGLALHLYIGPSGERPLYAEAAVAGKKKDAVLECALDWLVEC